MMGWHGGWGWGWGPMVFGGFLMLLFWGALIVLVVLAIRALWNRDGGGSRVSSGESSPSGGMPNRRALEILDERYARGEISREEYLEMRATLLSPGPHGGT